MNLWGFPEDALNDWIGWINDELGTMCNEFESELVNFTYTITTDVPKGGPSPPALKKKKREKKKVGPPGLKKKREKKNFLVIYIFFYF